MNISCRSLDLPTKVTFLKLSQTQKAFGKLHWAPWKEVWSSWIKCLCSPGSGTVMAPDMLIYHIRLLPHNPYFLFKNKVFSIPLIKILELQDSVNLVVVLLTLETEKGSKWQSYSQEVKKIQIYLENFCVLWVGFVWQKVTKNRNDKKDPWRTVTPNCEERWLFPVLFLRCLLIIPQLLIMTYSVLWQEHEKLRWDCAIPKEGLLRPTPYCAMLLEHLLSSYMEVGLQCCSPCSFATAGMTR